MSFIISEVRGSEVRGQISEVRGSTVDLLHYDLGSYSCN